MIIRDFRKEDLNDVIECVKESFSEEFGIRGLDEDVWRKLVRRRFSVFGRILFGFLGLLGKEPFKFFVADVDGKVIGTAMVTKRGRIGLVETVMVHRDFRRKGIATEIVKTAISYVRKRKFIRAILEVSSVNDPAKDLYMKLGFKKFDGTILLTIDIDSLPSLNRAEGVEVRDFQKSDIDGVYGLIKSSRGLDWLRVYDFKKNDLKMSMWNRIVRMSAVKKIVAVHDERIVGYASLSYTTAKEAGRIASIDVSPEMVSKGIVEELIRAGVDYVRSSGTKTVLVTALLVRDELIGKLESLGFKKRLVLEGMFLE